MRYFWLILLTSTLNAAGPVFKHAEPEQTEFQYIYQDLGKKAEVKNRTPVSSSEGCDKGSIAWDSSFVYVCTSTGTWKRAALAAF